MALTGIALRIYGGSQTGGLNQTPLVSVGSLQASFVPQPPTLVDEEKSWMITHAQDYSIYALHTKEYNTQEGLPGQLLICLLLPAGQRLDDKDPLTLLNTVLNLFTTQGMADGKLPAAPVDSSSFSDLLKPCKLTRLANPFPVMRGNMAATFQPISQAQLMALMRYSNYPVLANITRLEIGMKCPSTINIPMGGSQPQRPNHPNQESHPKEEVEEKTKETVLPSRTAKTFDEDWISAAPSASSETRANAGKINKWLTVLLVTIAIAGLAALLWFFLPFGKTKDTSQAPPQENATPAKNLHEGKEAEKKDTTTVKETEKKDETKAEERDKTDVTSFTSDGIVYKYPEPTPSQLQEWSKKYHSLCAGKIKTKKGDFNIPEEMMKEHPCLVYLILNSESLAEDKEKQDWFNLYGLMDEEQIYKLYDILYRERYKLEAIKHKYSNK